MTDKIRVLIVDDLPTTRESVSRLLQFEDEVELVAEAGTGLEAIAMVEQYQPDIVLMDINMPEMDGITASQKITKAFPRTQVIMMSVQSETDYMRRAMLAGARDFLTKPFSLDELLLAISEARTRQMSAPQPPPPPAPVADDYTADWFPTDGDAPRTDGGRVIMFYSSKGGSGCSMAAVNTAVGLARRRCETVILDGSLQFGDVGLLLNLKSSTSIIDIVKRMEDMDDQLLNSLLTTHPTGLKAALSPPSPEMAEIVRPEHIKTVVALLRPLFQFIIIDAPSRLDDMTLTMMDVADEIWLITQPNLAGIKNASRFFDLAQALEYDLAKLQLLVNGATTKQGIALADIGRVLRQPVAHAIPRDATAVEQAINQGTPIIESGANRPIVQSLQQLVNLLTEEATPAVAADSHAVALTKKSFWQRLFGR